MKLGFLTVPFAQRSLEEVAKWASDQGFQTLEVAAWPVGKAARRYAGVTHIDVDNLDQTGARKIVDMLKRHGLTISALAYYPNPLDPDLDVRQAAINHLKKVITAAVLLETPVVGTFTGRNKNLTVEQNLEEFQKVWPPIVRFAGDQGIKIAIENCPMIFTNDEWPGGNNLAFSPYIWKQMWEIIPDENFGLNLDPSHLIWLMIDYARAAREFGDRIFHVHAKDLRVDREGLYQRGVLSLGVGWQVPRLPGFGEVDWSKFIGALTEAGYDYVISIEHEDRAFEGNEELVKRGFLIARDVLRPYVY